MAGEIVYDLAESLRAHLQDKMVDNLPVAFETLLTYTDKNAVQRILKPSLIQVGRFQDDPTRLAAQAAIPSAYLSIRANDPDDMGDGWVHSVASPVGTSTSNLGTLIGYPRELGGSEHWWRRLSVWYEAWFVLADQTQAEAFRLANAIRGLIERLVTSKNSQNPHGWDCTMTDDFGETATQSFLAKSHTWEHGGPGDYFWKGQVWVAVKTVRE